MLQAMANPFLSLGTQDLLVFIIGILIGALFVSIKINLDFFK